MKNLTEGKPIKVILLFALPLYIGQLFPRGFSMGFMLSFVLLGSLVLQTLIAYLLTPRLQYLGVVDSEPIVWALMVIPLVFRILRNPILQNDLSRTT